jgi:hypothetical protein
MVLVDLWVERGESWVSGERNVFGVGGRGVLRWVERGECGKITASAPSGFSWKVA